MSDSSELPFYELLARLGARSPAPGGGSASAWAGALAAALVEMAGAYSGATAVGRRAAVLRTELLVLAEQELQAYGPVLEAMRLGDEDPTRERRLRDALSQASEGPLAIARAAGELAELGAGVADASTHALRGDAVAGVLVAEAAAQAAAQLVEVNLSGSGGDPRLSEARECARRAELARRRGLGAE